MNTPEERPWGYYIVLEDEPNHKIKRIVVYPQKRLSLQRHQKRQEHWYIVKGKAIVTLDDEEIHLNEKEYIDIPLYAKHRIQNREEAELVFIEIQTGTYFGEDDIERFEDDFGRV